MTVRFINHELKRLIKSYTFWLAVGMISFCFFYDVSYVFRWNAWQEIDLFYLFVSPFDLGLFYVFIPFAAVLPAVMSQIDDMASLNIRMRLHRTSYKRYIIEKLAASSIAPLLVGLLGCMVFFIFALIISPLDGPSGQSWRTIPMGRTYESYMIWYGIPYIIELIARVMVSCWLWGMIGFFIATLWENKAIALLLTFTIFYGCDFLMEWIGLPEWRTYRLFHSSLSYNGNPLFPYFQNGILIFTFSLLSGGSLYHRLKKI